jgi:hypothetical protein
LVPTPSQLDTRIGDSMPARSGQVRAHARRARRGDHGLDAPQRLVLSVDVDAGVAVGQPLAPVLVPCHP